MAKLTDLKNQAFTPSISESGGFTPSIDYEPDKVNPRDEMYAHKGSINGHRTVSSSSRPIISKPQGAPGIPTMDNINAINRQPEVVSMTGKPIKSVSGHTFVAADPTAINAKRPSQNTVNDPKTDAENMVFGILGPGGEIDEYKSRKQKEFREFNQRMAMEAEMSGKPLAELNEDGSVALVSKEEVNALLGESNDDNEKVEEVDVMAGFDENSKVEANTQQDIPVRARRVSQQVKQETPAPVDPSFDDIPIEAEPVEDDQAEDDSTDINEELSDMTSSETEVIESPKVDDDDEKLDVETVSDNTVPADDNFQIESGYIQEDEKVYENEDGEDVKETNESATLTDDQRRELLKNLVRQKIKPAVKKINLSGYSIAKKGTISSISLNATRQVYSVKWPLINTGICVRMKEFSGQDLERARIALNNNEARPVLELMYNHIISPKPDTLEGWMKSVAFEDYDHLFFAIYCASFNGANYIPIDCQNPACKTKTYITDNIPFMQMVKFDSDKTKKEFIKLYKEDPIESKGMFPSEIVPISENYAISFVTPSLYSTLMVTELLDDDFVNKYNNTVSNIPYIDTIYQIDSNSKQLIPVEWKTYANNDGKSLQSRVIRYEHVFNSMTIDELAAIDGIIQKLNEKSNAIQYMIPETTCPYCNHKNPEQVQSPSVLVFLRSQLGRLATS